MTIFSDANKRLDTTQAHSYSFPHTTRLTPLAKARITEGPNSITASNMQYDALQQKEEKLDLLLKDFNLSPIQHSLGMTLSGGERRRVEIARVHQKLF